MTVKVSEEEKLRDLAEKVSSEHYYKQIELFYIEARSKAKAVREIFEEDAIGQLFEENNDRE